MLYIAVNHALKNVEPTSDNKKKNKGISDLYIEMSTTYSAT